MKTDSNRTHVPMHIQYNTFAVIYTAKHLVKMGKIRIPGPDSFASRRNERFEFPDTVLISGISEFGCEIFNKDEQTLQMTCFPIFYKKVRILKNGDEFIFYILEDLIKGKMNEYGYLNDKGNDIIEMLKKYKYIEEDGK